MAAGSTYTPIATTTLGSTASSYTFSSIPSTYTDLVLVSNVATTVNGKDLAVQFNGDTGTNYSRTVLTGDSTTATSVRATTQAYMFLDYNGAISTTLGNNNCITQIMNYSNSTTYKTVLSRSNNAGTGFGVDANVGLWRSTAAITSMTIIATTSGVFATGSTFTLYGIAAA